MIKSSVTLMMLSYTDDVEQLTGLAAGRFFSEGGDGYMSIKKIAEKAGVSPATVSRVLNNPNYKCSVSGLRDKIWKTAIENSYRDELCAQRGGPESEKRRFRKAGENLVHQYPDDKNRFFHNGSVFCGAPSGDRK